MTDKPTHTPGPWAFLGPYKEGGWLDGGCLITTGYDVHEPDPDSGIFDGREPLHGRGMGFSEPDARLISAAPDLLAACERVMRSNAAKVELEVLAIAYAAIARAKGEA